MRQRGHRSGKAIQGRAERVQLADCREANMHSVSQMGISGKELSRFGLHVMGDGLPWKFRGPPLLPNNGESLRSCFSYVSFIDGEMRRMSCHSRADGPLPEQRAILWRGGGTKSNVTYRRLWKDA